MYMLGRKNGKVYLYTQVEPSSIGAVLEIDIYAKTCTIETNENEQFEADWDEYKVEITTCVQQCICVVKEKIINNMNVIHSYRVRHDEQNVEKNERFLKRNQELLHYLQHVVV